MKLPTLPDLDQFISHGCGFDPVTGEPMDTIYKVDADRLLKEYGRACAKAALEAAREVIAKYPTTYGTADLVIRKLMESIK